MRAIGVSLDTFSVRPPRPDELRGEDDRREAGETYTLLARPLRDFFAAHVQELALRPGRYLKTLALSFRHRPPGWKAALLSIAHFGESILLAKELKRRDIVHLHNHFANPGATVGMLASDHLGIGWSFTIHGISEFDYPAGLLLPAKICAARFVSCVSYFGRAQAARLVSPKLWSKLTIVRCGLDLDLLPEAGAATSDGVRIIVVGRLSPEKGIAGLLQAMSLMTIRPRPTLVIVGDGPLRGELESQVRSLELSDVVEFRGSLAEAETLSEIARSDILVLPSFMEGLPIVLMEALALGVPVVATRVAGIPELVEEGRTGLLFSPSNWHELAEALDRLANDAELRRRLGDAGPRRIREEFDVRMSAARLRDLLRTGVQSGATVSAPPS